MQFNKAVVLTSLFHVLFCSSAVLADQDGDYTYTVSGDNATITAYTGTGGDISIPATLGGHVTVAIGDEAFANNTTLTSVIIPSSVKSVGYQAFRYCTNVTSLTIPEGVTTVGIRAFARMYALTSVYIPASVTSIGDYGFFGGTSNTGITVHADNPNYSSIDGVLYNKDKTTLIQYPCGKAGAFTTPASVTSIGIAAFQLCIVVTSVTLTDSVASIAESGFESCTGLTSVIFNGNIVSIGGYAFYGCTSLTSARFYGNAPTMGSGVFDSCASGFTVYYTAGKTGFANPWYGYTTSACTDADNDTYAIEGGACGAIDCNNNNSAVHPGASDANCNGIDDNCNSQTDEGYLPVTSCFLPGACAAGNVASSCASGGVVTPCATGTPATETCNGIDDDCDSVIDNGFIVTTFYRDADNDTYGEAANTTVACTAPEGYVDNSKGFDCDDNASAVNPGAVEACNGLDDNCDGIIDNGLDNCPPDNCTDADGDGYFVGAGCSPFDCDDTDWTIHEGCEAAPCSLTIAPKQITKLGTFFEPVIPFIISADKESGIAFGTFSIRFSSDFIHPLVRVRIGTRMIIGFYVVNPFRVEKGDTTVEVEFYGQAPDTRCADFTVK